MKRVLRRNFFEYNDTLSIAKNLLGKFLVQKTNEKENGYMITEVEAYDGVHDKASHAHRGRTERNSPMFGYAGNWYVYFTYGMYWMLNIVTGPKNYPAAILIRGIISLSNLPAGPLRQSFSEASRQVRLLNGPGKLTRALKIDKNFNGKIALPKNNLWIEDRGVVIAPQSIKSATRVGVAYAGEWSSKPYRFYIKSPILLSKDAILFLKPGSVGIIPTDTIYGVVCSALNKQSVERIYNLRRRDKNKPTIVLIGSLEDLKLFGIGPSKKIVKILQKIWPDKISIILPCKDKKFEYLHRGAKTIAFRMPNNKTLREILKQTGPLVAPSANPEGKKPATTILEAQKYFKDKVDFYVDGGKMTSLPSTLISIDEKGRIEIKRQGAIKIK